MERSATPCFAGPFLFRLCPALGAAVFGDGIPFGDDLAGFLDRDGAAVDVALSRSNPPVLDGGVEDQREHPVRLSYRARPEAISDQCANPVVHVIRRDPSDLPAAPYRDDARVDDSPVALQGRRLEVNETVAPALRTTATSVLPAEGSM